MLVSGPIHYYKSFLSFFVTADQSNTSTVLFATTRNYKNSNSKIDVVKCPNFFVETRYNVSKLCMKYHENHTLLRNVFNVDKQSTK
jgi:hypothetical protein